MAIMDMSNLDLLAASVKPAVGKSALSLESLRYQHLCVDCPFGKNSKKVAARGPINSPYVVVGEGPGKQELLSGMPFMGPSGKLLDMRAPEILDSWYVTNAAMCGKPKAEKDDNEQDRQKLVQQCTGSCRRRLLAEIRAYPRKLIVALGNGALWSLTGDFKLKITQQRGRIIPSPLAEFGILPIVHPAALLRGTGNFRQFREDLSYATTEACFGHFRQCIEPSEIIVHETDTTKADQAVTELLQRKYIAKDVETTSLKWRLGRILYLGAASSPHRVHIFGPAILESGVLKRLFKACDGNDHHSIWHNGKFDANFCRKPPYDLPAEVNEDTLLLSYALDERGGVHDLEQVASDLLSAEDYKHVIKQFVRKKTDTYELVPKPILIKYLAQDVSRTLQIFDLLRPRVAADPDLEKLYTKTLIPASELLTRIEAAGFLTDEEQIHYVAKKLQAEADAAEKDLFELVGYRLNLNSPNQVAELLYGKLALEPFKGRKSTDKRVLAHFDHPAVRALTKFRRAVKLKGTYADAILRERQDNGRVYSTFLLHGTPTGRLASRGPNMQNIPRDKDVRGMFIAAKGKILLEKDLDQAELRSLADCSGDSYLCGLYNADNRSLHDEMSEFLFGTDFNEDQRMRAKAVNFGIPYGREAGSIAEEFEVATSDATEWIAAWFRRAPGAHEFIKSCKRAALKGRTLITPFGAKKRHGLVTSQNIRDLMNQASNFPHQNIASNINLHTAIRIRHYLDDSYPGAQIVNLVHDSTVTECDNDPEVVQNILLKAFELFPDTARTWRMTKVPFIADAKIGPSWGQGVKIKPADLKNGQLALKLEKLNKTVV
jgi:uracil-DNA glycosylase family 4